MRRFFLLRAVFRCEIYFLLVVFASQLSFNASLLLLQIVCCCDSLFNAYYFFVASCLLFWVFSGIISLIINCFIFIVAGCFFLLLVLCCCELFFIASCISFWFVFWSLRGQTGHSVPCKRISQKPKSNLFWNPQHCYFSLIFFAVLDSKTNYLKHCTAQNFSKNRRIWGICNRICGMYNRSQLLT